MTTDLLKTIKFILAGFLLTCLSLSLASAVYYFNYYQSRFLPQTYLDQIDISGLDLSQALEKSQNKQNLAEYNLELIYQDLKSSTTAASLDLYVNYQESLDIAFKANHKNFLKNLFNKQEFKSIKYLNQEKLKSYVQNFAQQIDQEGFEPTASLKYGQAIIHQGQVGQKLNQEELLNNINNNIKNIDSDLSFVLQAEQIGYQLNPAELNKSQQRADNLINSEINLISQEHKDLKIKLSAEEIINLLKLPEGFSQKRIDNLLDKINQQIKQDPKNAEFDYTRDGDHITVNKFIPHQYGLALDFKKTQENLLGVLEKLENGNNKILNNNLPVTTTTPDITLDQTNDLGINELIGLGESHYAHSIPNRIYNVSFATDKLSGAVVAPGEEFRFNQTLGEVSKKTGYKSAYVIKDGQTVLGDGGGVCQVSTTTFRAALAAGLEITARKAHAYRVSYYELDHKPGVDATVYPGSADLRFVNNTPAYILITGQAFPEDLYMYIKIYGTSDGRTTEITDHKTWGYQAAPPAVYYPTADLPSGVTQRIDQAKAGIKASFKNVVKDKDGNVVSEKIYYSSYRPWSAKYMVGI